MVGSVIQGPGTLEFKDSLTLYTQRVKIHPPPLEKMCCPKADFADLLKEILKTDSTSEWPLMLATYFNTKK